MATQQTTTAGRALVAPSVILLFVWMIVPLVMTLYFSTLRYSLLDPDNVSFVGLQNYTAFLTDPDFLTALYNTLGPRRLGARHQRRRRHSRGAADGSAGVRPEHLAADGDRAVLRHADGQRAGVEEPADEPRIPGCSPGSPGRLGFDPIVWFTNWPMLSVIIIVSWEWLPFASLILLTALQSLDEEQKEAASLDGAGPILLLRLYRAAAYRARDHRRHPDRDDFPSERVRGNLRDHLRRPRQSRRPTFPSSSTSRRC